MPELAQLWNMLSSWQTMQEDNSNFQGATLASQPHVFTQLQEADRERALISIAVAVALWLLPKEALDPHRTQRAQVTLSQRWSARQRYTRHAARRERRTR
jgi:hypothetical protein